MTRNSDRLGSSVKNRSSIVQLVAPVPPPYGGMALQAALLRRLLNEDGVKADLIGHNQPFPAPLRFLELVPALRAVLRSARFCLQFWKNIRDKDVVHILSASWLHFLMVVCPAIWMGRLRGKRVVLNYRAGDADQFLRHFGWLTRSFFKMADITVTPSKFLADVIQRRVGVPVAIVPNIVDLSAFRYRDRLPLQPKMLVTRHLEAGYDLECVLRAFGLVQKVHPEASLWIAGTGSAERRLRWLVATWKLQNVRFLGYIDHDSLPELYNQCDIMLNGSRVDNFPGSLMEASAAGLAVVSTDAGGIPHMYESGKNALLVNIGDWKTLGSEVLRLLLDQDLAAKLISAGLELSQQCEWRSVRRVLYAVYGWNSLEWRPISNSAVAGFVSAGEGTII